MIEGIVVGSIVVTLNVLDSVTTHLGFRQYPDKKLRAEGNPFMRWLMLKNRMWAEVIKQVSILSLVIWVLVSRELNSLILVALILGIVVLNNTYIIVSRAITKRKVTAPFEGLRRLLHLPESCKFGMALIIIIGLSYGIYQLLPLEMLGG